MDYIKTIDIMYYIKIVSIIVAYSPIIYAVYQLWKLVKIGNETLKRSMQGENPEADKYGDFLKNFISKKPDEQTITWALLERNMDAYKWLLRSATPGAGIVTTAGLIYTDYISSITFWILLAFVFYAGILFGLILKKIDMDVAKYYIIKNYRKSNNAKGKRGEVNRGKYNESSKVNKEQ